MKRTLTSIFLTATMTAMFGVTSLNAQDHLASADIPFAFHADGQVMPAGRYTVNDTTGTTMAAITIRNQRGNSLFLSATPGNDAKPNDPKLTFRVHNGEYTLEDVDLPGSPVSRKIRESNASYKVSLEPRVTVHLTR